MQNPSVRPFSKDFATQLGPNMILGRCTLQPVQRLDLGQLSNRKGFDPRNSFADQSNFSTMITLARYGLILWVCLGGAGLAQETVSQFGPEKSFAALDEKLQVLKREVLEINQELVLLEEELLYPPKERILVFVSMDEDVSFGMDEVKLEFNGEVVRNHRYTPRQVDALRRGGVHRVHTGTLPTGKHRIVASFVGTTPVSGDYHREMAVGFIKGFRPKYVEFRIVQQNRKKQPEIIVNEW